MSDYFPPISKWSSKQHIWQILKSNGENSLATWQLDYRDFPPMSTNLQIVCDSSSSSFLLVFDMVRPCQCVPTRRRERGMAGYATCMFWSAQWGKKWFITTVTYHQLCARGHPPSDRCSTITAIRWYSKFLLFIPLINLYPPPLFQVKMLIYILESICSSKNESTCIIPISVQYKQVGGSTYTSVDIATGCFSFCIADDCDSGAGGGGGPFRFSKKESRKVIVRSVVLAFRVHQCLSIKSTINACQNISVNVNMVEGPSTTATLSNQFVAKRWRQRTRQVCCGCSSEKQFNSSWSHPKGDNPYLPLHQGR